MASRISALIRNFLQTDGDALYLVPGEKIFIVRGTAKTVVGREVLSEEAFRNVAAELVPGATAEVLAERRHRLPVDEVVGSERAELQFGLSGGAPALMVFRLKAGPVAPRPGPEPALPPLPVAQSVHGLPLAQTAVPRAPAPGREAAPASFSASFPAAVPPAGRGAPRPASPRATAASGSLEGLLASMVVLDTSAVYIAPGAAPLARVDLELLAAEGAQVLSPLDTDRMLTAILPERRAAELESGGSTRFVHTVPGFGRFRVHVSQERAGLSAVLFPLPASVAPPRDELRALVGPGGGLVLVASPAGGGRTTTLGSLVAHLVATRDARVVTVEDPIELPLEGKLGMVSQREAGGPGRPFALLLEAALGERPDAVALSDVPDPETAALVAESASAGTLVLAAVRASTATGALAALTGRLPADRRVRLRSLLGPSVRAVVVQVLCRRRDGGQVAAVEIVPGGGALGDLVALDRLEGLPALVDGVAVQGGVSLNASLVELVRSGGVEPREALARTYDPGRLRDLLTAAGLVPPA